MIKFQKQTNKLLLKQQTLYEHILNQNLQTNQNQKIQKFEQILQVSKKEEEKQNTDQIRNQHTDQQYKKRSWHKRLDQFVNQQEMKKGKFSQDEVDYIMKVVNEYLMQNNLNYQDLKDYIELKSFGLSNIWLTIAKQIPNRTIDSVYKLIRRKLDSKNRQGYWSKDEEANLIKYVQQYGRKWREISKHFNRTPDNIRTKYNSIGEFNYLFRMKAQWTIEEFLKFITHIQNSQSLTLLNSNYYSILQTKFGEQFIETKFCLNFRKMSQFDRETFLILKQIVSIPKQLNIPIKWTEMAQEIKTKTKDDLRQMWQKLSSQ